MRRSCLVVLVLLAAVLMAASVSLRRCYLKDASDVQGSATAVEFTNASEPQEDAQATLDAALRSLDAGASAGIEGLALETLRPLSVDPLTVYGLTATDERIYYAGCDGSGQCGQVYMLDRTTFAPMAQTSVPQETDWLPGGLQMQGDAVWVWQFSGDGEALTTVTILDRETLQERSRLTLDAAARALVVVPDGTICGTSRDGAWFYRWDSAGLRLSRQASATGAIYADCELLEGSLVCAGIGEDGVSVLDVLDTRQFSLLTRHRAAASTEGGARVVGGAWAYHQDRFMFVPEAGEMPLLWTYALNGTTLREFVPSVQP